MNEDKITRSEKQKGLLGDEYIVHRDESGNEIGRSKRRETLLQGVVTENLDLNGHVESTSRKETTLLGEERIVTRSADRKIESITTPVTDAILREDHLVSRDREGKVISRTYNQKSFAGGYRETIPAAFGEGGKALGILAALLGLLVVFAIFATMILWLPGAAIAGIVAFFHAPSVAKIFPETAVSFPVPIQRKRRQSSYLRLDPKTFKDLVNVRDVLWIPVAAASGFLILSFTIMAAEQKEADVWEALGVLGVVLGAFASYFWAKKMYTWRLNGLLLESQGIDTGNAGTIARVWNGFAIAVVVILVVLPLLISALARAL